MGARRKNPVAWTTTKRLVANTALRTKRLIHRILDVSVRTVSTDPPARTRDYIDSTHFRAQQQEKLGSLSTLVARKCSKRLSGRSEDDRYVKGHGMLPNASATQRKLEALQETRGHAPENPPWLRPGPPRRKRTKPS
jgi:hypothetical protein